MKILLLNSLDLLSLFSSFTVINFLHTPHLSKHTSAHILFYKCWPVIFYVPHLMAASIIIIFHRSLAPLGCRRIFPPRAHRKNCVTTTFRPLLLYLLLLNTTHHTSIRINMLAKTLNMPPHLPCLPFHSGLTFIYTLHLLCCFSFVWLHFLAYPPQRT